MIATATHPTRARRRRAPGAGRAARPARPAPRPGSGISTSTARCSPRALSPAAASAARQSAGARAPAGSGEVAIPPRIPIIAGAAPSDSAGPRAVQGRQLLDRRLARALHPLGHAERDDPVQGHRRQRGGEDPQDGDGGQPMTDRSRHPHDGNPGRVPKPSLDEAAVGGGEGGLSVPKSPEGKDSAGGPGSVHAFSSRSALARRIPSHGRAVPGGQRTASGGDTCCENDRCAAGRDPMNPPSAPGIFVAKTEAVRRCLLMRWLRFRFPQGGRRGGGCAPARGFVALVAAPSHWPEELERADDEATAAAAKRRTLTLSQAEESALRYQPTMRQARAQTDAAQGRVEQARSGLPASSDGDRALRAHDRQFRSAAGRDSQQHDLERDGRSGGASGTTASPNNSLGGPSTSSISASRGSQLLYDFGQTSDRWRRGGRQSRRLSDDRADHRAAGAAQRARRVLPRARRRGSDHASLARRSRIRRST